MNEEFTFVQENANKKIPNKIPQVIKIVGIGGCGNKAIDYLMSSQICSPLSLTLGDSEGTPFDASEFIAINSDPQDLNTCRAINKILIGPKATHGRGCGGDSQLGRKACEESLAEILKTLDGADLVFISAGMGGGTGSGAAPVVVKALATKEDPPLIVSVLTTPFPWEKKRQKLAEQVIQELNQYSHCMLIFSNIKLVEKLPKNMPICEAKEKANEVLYKALYGLMELLSDEGGINLDFADVSATLRCKGLALMGVGEASGEERARKAYRNAIDSPLMAENSIKGAKKLLVNVVADKSLTMEEYALICTLATDETDSDADVFTGLMTKDMPAEGLVRVTLMASGIQKNEEEWDKSADDVIDLETIVDDSLDLTVRPEDTQAPVQQPSQAPPHSMGTNPSRVTQFGAMAGRKAGQPREPFQPIPPAKPAPSAKPAQPVKPALGTGGRIIKKPGLHNPTPPLKSPYENHAGVDPVNTNPGLYDTPSFLRKDAS
ncbi:MAG: hypothetical protein LBF22_06165 [Deltaproteobacteria bacterium]|jgi:cell division protein FtsZ|nr:hypothetical protein [Deltaproteobacteria bacterium]